MSLSEIADIINAAGVIGALGVAGYQTRRLVLDARSRDEDVRTERALSFYRDLVVDGDTAQSFHRMSVLLRRTGTAAHGFTTWSVIGDEALQRGGLLDPEDSALEGPFQDLYQVLWFFERVDRALQFGLVHEDVLFSTVGFHCWWWGQLLRRLDGPKAAKSIRELGPRAARWAARNDELDRWLEHCPSDFDGGAPVMPADLVPAGVPTPVEEPAALPQLAVDRREPLAE